MSFNKVNRPLKGDLLRVHRKEGYYHFGIAVDSDTVIHFTALENDLADNKKDMRIIETSLIRFLKGDQLEVEQPFNSQFTRDEVVKKAKKYVNCAKFRDKYYNFLTNNCEHFARYCYDGDPQSKQVVNGAVLAVIGSAALVGTVAASLLVKGARKKKKATSPNVRKIEKK